MLPGGILPNPKESYMSVNDWAGIMVGLATLYLLWQQNQLFRRQNEIFAAQAGASKMPSGSSTILRLARYWPMLVMVVLTFATGVFVSYDLYDRHQMTAQPHLLLLMSVYVASVLLLLAVLSYVIRLKAPNDPMVVFHAREENESLKRKATPPSLEIRPLPEAALKSSAERGYSHYRMSIHNSGSETARNVQVRLVSIEPPPISEYFRARADFPYHVRLAHVADGPVDTSTDHDINPGTSKQFELLFFWESADHRIMVDGIDTKQVLSRDARFSIEDKECWHLKYEVSSTQDAIQRPIFFVRREDKNIVMSRLV
jgi:hypothetical protein